MGEIITDSNVYALIPIYNVKRYIKNYHIY